MWPRRGPARRVPAGGRADYATGVLQRLYPAPLQVSQPGAGGAARAHFLLLPTAARARLVVPAGNRWVAARAVQRQLTGRRPRTRLARLVLALVVGSGAADRLARGRLVVTGPPDVDSIEEVLARALRQERVLVSLPLSPPRANRKPVLQVSDPTGRAVAFVKVGHDDLTRRLVLAEGDSLQRIAAAGLPHICVPKVLARLEWNGLALLALEPLPLSRKRLRGARARAAFLLVVQEIAQLGARGPGSWQDNPFRVALHEQLAACGPRADPLRAHLAALDAVAPVLATGSWHGDLNPGNIALLETQSLVWDWERFGRDVPVGFDLLHHDLHREVTMSGIAPRVAARRVLYDAPAALSALGVDSEAADATARLYLLTLAARYLRDQQSEAGAALGDVEPWLLPALDAVQPASR